MTHTDDTSITVDYEGSNVFRNEYGREVEYYFRATAQDTGADLALAVMAAIPRGGTGRWRTARSERWAICRTTRQGVGAPVHRTHSLAEARRWIAQHATVQVVLQ